MRSIAMIGSVAVLLTAQLSTRAEDWQRSSPGPYTPSYIIAVSAPGPGCASPIVPPAAAPGSMPSAMPSAPSTAPGAAPSTAPGMGAAPGAAAPSDTGAGAAAAAGGDTGGGAAGEAGSSATASAAPGMIGDLLGGGVGFLRSASGSSRSQVRIPLAERGPFKISENESPMPMTRVFLAYNYFNNANTFGGSNFDLHRETVGFEYAFLGGNASVGMRIPMQFTDGTAGSGAGTLDGFNDMSLVLKYAFYRDCDAGNVLSGGMVVTAPTGRDETLVDGTNINGWLIQPWVGGIWNMGNMYVHGFSAAVIPAETKDATLITNDIGVGYRIYQCADRDSALSSIIPTVEFHATTPINHNGINSGLVGYDNIFDVTAGVHIGLYGCSFLTIAGAVPVSGPRPDSFELICQFNIRF